jgi:hypothetical protein
VLLAHHDAVRPAAAALTASVRIASTTAVGGRLWAYRCTVRRCRARTA